VAVHDPSGNVIYQQDASFMLSDNSVYATRQIGQFSYAFTAPGIYPIVISSLTGPTVTAESAGNIDVLPNLHIQIKGSLQPTDILPGASAKVHVNLSIQGAGGNP
jgi:hypothetical protein